MAERQLKRAHDDVALPSRMHLVADIPLTSRVIIVGDIHGCFDELVELLAVAEFDESKDTLILVGDLVNKGPKSPEVVQFARQKNALCVRGNHDDAALSAYYAWKSGGDDALPAKYGYVKSFSEEDIRYLEELPFTISLPAQNAMIVHAGIKPGVALEGQHPIDMYKMRFLEYESTNEEPAAFEVKPSDSEVVQWATQWKGPQHIYFGHDAKAGLQQEAFATGLDTGCCYGRQLTAIILPTRELVAVKARAQYSAPTST
ncbi:hypothetical protein Poli38472_005634 [Pythium oligandrum]|uniref:Calcineurin-like phosphoesterase domain-containing protein n=1 Tax=Pythium oligandrum TaxID=41045 RepID=A0A8K1FHR1_PYTOL|nr:hypothetical protein Poli38472_005634 [Pythium oligandrum]|eukprot:TMW63016.1 hypothetical protein Poli38472_005634 [Pythium oligandrum]